MAAHRAALAGSGPVDVQVTLSAWRHPSLAVSEARARLGRAARDPTAIDLAVAQVAAAAHSAFLVAVQALSARVEREVERALLKKSTAPKRSSER